MVLVAIFFLFSGLLNQAYAFYTSFVIPEFCTSFLKQFSQNKKSMKVILEARARFILRVATPELMKLLPGWIKSAVFIL